MPANATEERRRLLQLYGATIIDSPADQGSNGAVRLALEIAEREPKYFMPFQYANEANPRAHYEGTGAEIAEALDRVDVLVAGLGTGGTLMGVGRRLREELGDGVKIVAAEPMQGEPVQGLRSLDDGQPRDSLLMPQSAIHLRGEHNLRNVLAACAIAVAAGLPVEVMRAAVQDFRGVPHRLQFVRAWRGADWYNDSIATAPERSIAAIRSFVEPLVLLAGGRDKDLPWDEFTETVSRRVDHLVIFGEAADKILQAVEDRRSTKKGWTRPLTCTRCKNLQEAVRVAAALVQPGDVVLLSPGGTSFDEFRDFEERGECFVRWVNELP